jgi:4-hydroxy-tetrahydrodipicolinate synthase
MKLKKQMLQGVWSATPTPFTDKMNIDIVAVRRLVNHHLRLGVKGLFLAGTCGEGPWMPSGKRRTFVKAVAKYAKGKLVLSVQVTDNSAERILENIREAKEDGADIAIIAPPFFLMNATGDTLLNLYKTAIRNSPLPVGIYDRGKYSSVFVSNKVLKSIYSERKVALIKDSSDDPIRMKIALSVREQRPGLKLFNGNEFKCAEYIRAGYNGLMLGGGIFNGYLAGKIIEAVKTGDFDLAYKLQARMNRMMYSVYGGKKIACWLSGEKKLMVDMGVFRTWKGYLDYPLTENCIKSIKRVLERERDVLLP